MYQKTIIYFLVGILFTLSFFNIAYHVSAQTADNPVFMQLFNKILADADLENTNGTVVKADSFCRDNECYLWSQLYDKDRETFVIEWNQIDKGNQQCLERGYAFKKIDEVGNTTCNATKLCFVQPYSQAQGYSYCNSPDYYLYPSLLGDLKPRRGSFICCKAWYKDPNPSPVPTRRSSRRSRW